VVARVLIIGGYGNFGSYIARSLASDADLRLLIGGRSAEMARTFAASLEAVHSAEGHALDIDGELAAAFARTAPDIVVHTAGPFQTQDHRVARACIARGCHYLDLADARDFVATIDRLDADARAKDVLVLSGASSVPCLTAAVIDAYLPAFARLEAIDYGISAAQHTNRGLATTAAVLSYVGKPMTVLRNGAMRTVHGWEDTHAERYPGLGWRLFGNATFPTLPCFPNAIRRSNPCALPPGTSLSCCMSSRACWGLWCGWASFAPSTIMPERCCAWHSGLTASARAAAASI
jgi:saccharopine dehydrogenase-like NADP-dependent oxidoreductase